jgi:hypothetical protein
VCVHARTCARTSCKISLIYLTICEMCMNAVLVGQLIKIVFLRFTILNLQNINYFKMTYIRLKMILLCLFAKIIINS